MQYVKTICLHRARLLLLYDGLSASEIAGQREHHRRVSFKDEFKSLLNAHHVPYDERYVWD